MAGLVLGLAVFAAPAIARAGTVTLTTGVVVTHTLPDGGSFVRDPSLNAGGINFEDCEQDVTISFPITVSGFTPGQDYLYAYAGTNCQETAELTGASGDSCWLAVRGSDVGLQGSGTQGDIDYSQGSFTVPVRVREILSQAFGGVSSLYVPVPTGQGVVSPTAADDAICFAQPTSAAINIDLDFVVLNTGDPTTGTGIIEAFAEGPLGADLAAAAPPTGYHLGIGDDFLTPQWNTITDPDIVGFNVYYASAGGAAVVISDCDDGGSGSDGASSVDAGSIATGGDDGGDEGDDSGADAGTTGDAGTAVDTTGCITRTVLDTAPQQPDGSLIPFDDAGYQCISPFPVAAYASSDIIEEANVSMNASSSSSTTGSDAGDEAGTTTTTTSNVGSIGPLSLQPQEFDPSTLSVLSITGDPNSAKITGLTNGSEYAVAVAARDAYGNVGALTLDTSGRATCQIPLPNTEFFETYVNDGGGANGCSVGDSQLPGGTGAVSFLGGMVGVAMLRRRQKKRATTSS